MLNATLNNYFASKLPQFIIGIICLLFSMIRVSAQIPDGASVNRNLNLKNSFKQDTVQRVVYHSPKKAALFSAMLPGLGQVYNRKYWKVPLIYAAAGGLIYSFQFNQSRYVNYREAYGLFAATGVLFNHESPLRPSRIVTRKIISTAVRIANGSKERLQLGNVDVHRDWGWAPEYVEAIWRILQHDQAEDFVIATGHMHSLSQFVDQVFAVLGLAAKRQLVKIKKVSSLLDNFCCCAKFLIS